MYFLIYTPCCGSYILDFFDSFTSSANPDGLPLVMPTIPFLLHSRKDQDTGTNCLHKEAACPGDMRERAMCNPRK